MVQTKIHWSNIRFSPEPSQNLYWGMELTWIILILSLIFTGGGGSGPGVNSGFETHNNNNNFTYTFHGDPRATFAEFFGTSNPFESFFNMSNRYILHTHRKFYTF